MQPPPARPATRVRHKNAPAPERGTVSIRRFIRRSQLLPWALLLLVGLGVLWGLHRNAQAALHARSSQQELTLITLTLADVLRMETGLRGYVITGETQSLRPYYAAREELPAHLTALQRANAEQPDEFTQQALDSVNRIEQLMARWEREAVRPIINLRPTNPEAALDYQREGLGEDLTTEVQELLWAYRAQEEAIQARLDRERAWSRVQLGLVTVLGLLAALVISFVSIAGVSRALQRTFNDLMHATRRIANGHYKERAPGSFIAGAATLAADFNRMAERLERRENDLTDTIRELRQVSEFNQLVLDSAAEGMFGVDFDGRITFVNPAAQRLTGFTAAEMLGKQQHALIHHSHEDGTARLAAECPIHAARVDGQERRVDNEVFWRHDGSCFRVEYTAVPMRGPNGNAEGVLVTFRDVTERHQAQSALQRERDFSKAIIEGAGSLLIVLDRQGCVVRFNPEFERLTGYHEADVLSRPYWEMLLPLDDAHDGQQDFAQLPVRKFPHTFERHLLTREGERRLIAWSVNALRDEPGRITHFIANGVDVSDERQAMNGLKRSNAELEQFAYVASHDLQAPLRAVTSFTQLLGRHLDGQLDDRGRMLMGHIEGGAQRMKVLIDELLVFSRASRARTEFTTVDMNLVARQAQLNLQEDLKANEVELTVEQLPSVHGNFQALVQVTQNLIGNAVKYRKADAPPHVHISAVRDGNCWQFSVRDNGIGIDAQYFEKIFLVFQRLHRHDQIEGTGIGLAVCKRIVERHGGRLWVESTVGEGSTFHFTLLEE